MINTVRIMKLTNLASAIGGLALVAVLAACSSSSKSDGAGNPPTQPANNTQQQSAPATDGGSTGDTTGDANSACQPDVVVQFCETIDITGAVTVSGTAPANPQFDQDSVDATCASWVNHQPENTDYPQFAVPNEAIGGHKLQAQWALPYKVGTTEFGAKTDPTAANYGYSLNADLTVDDKNYVVITHGTDVESTATGSYEINADGSGKLTFEKLLAGDGTSASNAISGSISWTCVDPQS
jgi:hypothetical protein